MIVYKICRKNRKEEIVSISYFHIASLAVEYRIGEKVRGKYGPLFAYNSIRRVVDEIGGVWKNFVVLECNAELSNSKVRTILNPVLREISSLKLFWKNPKRSIKNYTSSIYIYNLDEGVVLCKSITPIRIVHSPYENS